MPVSEIDNIPAIINQVARIHPSTVLDLGVGGGKYGVLCREVLDWKYGRMERPTWETEINGVEGYYGYKNPAWGVYNVITRRDFSKFHPGFMAGYDLVLMIDSLEHIEKEKGKALLTHLIENNANVIVSCPDGDYPQGAVFGNELEVHRAVWTKDDLKLMGGRVLYHGVCTVCRFNRQ